MLGRRQPGRATVARGAEEFDGHDGDPFPFLTIGLERRGRERIADIDGETGFFPNLPSERIPETFSNLHRPSRQLPQARKVRDAPEQEETVSPEYRRAYTDAGPKVDAHRAREDFAHLSASAAVARFVEDSVVACGTRDSAR